ncbi:unnamed protein product [Clonostachys solani]|uniref:Uncharacterized protein n=1 Tax=Clonostachys solani TaxID=160281 RepID=A0A9N9W301_9HYPO|nr:unnamed protein product [Clonostachys solani]
MAFSSSSHINSTTHRKTLLCGASICPSTQEAMPTRANLSKMTGCKACGLNYTGAAKVCQCVKRDSQNFHHAGGQQYGTSLGRSASKRLKAAPDKHGKAPGEQGIP